MLRLLHFRAVVMFLCLAFQSLYFCRFGGMLPLTNAHACGAVAVRGGLGRPAGSLPALMPLVGSACRFVGLRDL